MIDFIQTTTKLEDNYHAIKEAVAETAHDGWFLAEHARRSRVCGTKQVLNMSKTINTIKGEIAKQSTDGATMTSAHLELNIVVDETETAPSTSLANAEKLQECDLGSRR